MAGKRHRQGRWVDCNKGDAAKPDVRCRWVAKEVAYQHSDQLFAATPPLEALRLLVSEAATRAQPVGVSRCGGARRKKLIFLDAKKAHLHAPAVRDVCVELPPERARPGYCCRLRRCLCGTRDAPQQWGGGVRPRRSQSWDSAEAGRAPCVSIIPAVALWDWCMVMTLSSAATTRTWSG